MAAGHISIDNTFKLSALDENRTESGELFALSTRFILLFHFIAASCRWVGGFQRAFVISVTLA